MRKFFIAAMLATMSVAALAQDTTVYDCVAGNYLTIDMGGGWQPISYKVGDRGDKNTGMGFDVRAGYRHYFSPHWGVGVGVEYQNFRSKSILDYVQKIDDAIDEEGVVYQHRTYINGVEERQKLGVVGIPLGGYYQTMAGKRIKLNLGAGLCFGFVVKSRYEVLNGDLETTGYYKDDNIEFDDMYWHSFYSNDVVADGGFDANLRVSPFVEAGVMFALNARLDLTANLLGSYGINRLADKSDKPLYDPDCKTDIQHAKAVYNGLLNSEVVGKSHSSTLGLQLGVRYRLLRKPSDKISSEDLGQLEREEAERLAQEQAEKERLEREEAERLAQEQAEKERLEREEAERLAQEQAERERLEREEAERLAQEQAEKERLEKLRNSLRDAVDAMNPYGFGNCGSLSPESASTVLVDNLAKAMMECPDARILVTGHTCNIGSAEVNKVYAQKRADWLRDELVKRGVPRDRVETDSKWFTEPLVPNTSEANRRKNRRLEVKILSE